LTRPALNLATTARDDAENYLALPEHADEALACQFVLRSADTFRFVNPWGRWMLWVDTHWKEDRTLKAYDSVRSLCAETARMLAVDLNVAAGSRERGAAMIASAQKVAAVERLARADRLLALDVDAWDADPWLLNTPEGTIDLRTGLMRAHRSGDYITKVTAVAPGGDCPLWRESLETWTGGDVELVAFLRRFIGYALTGDIREHALAFFYGSGANGKSSFLNPIQELLGDYCTVAAMETFVESKSDRHPADLAMLNGARLVIAQETEEGRRWAEARIKSLTSGDPVTARFMRRDFFTFRPTFKLLFAGNHRPGLRNVSEAMRRRINLVPFRVTIPEEKRDPLLLQKLRQEWPGILAWAIEGCMEWQRIGLAPPESVRAATADYLSDEDVLALWIEEAIEGDAGGFVRVADLHGSYKTWAQRFDERFQGLKRFSQVLEDRGFVRGRHPKTRDRGFVGIRMRTQVGETHAIA
jgi:putative DNA primase/helicase